jgi:hypothetical protein
MRLTRAMGALAIAESGKGVIKFTLGTCLLAIAVATSSPAFQANPLLTGTIMEMRKHLPETLDKITKAMGG